MKVALTVVRLAYVVVGLTALVSGLDRWQAAESVSLVLLAGVLALAAAAWVTSDGLMRGAIASIGIVVGALLVVYVSFGFAAFLIYFGEAARATPYAIPGLLAISGAWVMWRMSHRPWDRPPSP